MPEFEEFAAGRAGALYRSARLLTGDHHRAEDLVQETLAKVYVRWHRRLAPPIVDPAAYAQTALVRTFLSGRRRRHRAEVAYAVVPDRPGGPVDSDLHVTLVAALSELTPVDRAVVVLRYLDDLSVEEVADRTGLSPGAVRNRSTGALALLRPRLDPPTEETR